MVGDEPRATHEHPMTEACPGPTEGARTEAASAEVVGTDAADGAKPRAVSRGTQTLEACGADEWLELVQI